jgi:hypothetical protein
MLAKVGCVVRVRIRVRVIGMLASEGACPNISLLPFACRKEDAVLRVRVRVRDRVGSLLPFARQMKSCFPVPRNLSAS